MNPENTFFVSPKVGFKLHCQFSLPIPMRVRETRSKTEPARAENQYSEPSLCERLSLERTGSNR